jgi:hypothetical protein
MSKTRKYERKRTGAGFNDPFDLTRQPCAINRCSGERFLSFILAAKSSSEMFTTYSHALCFCLASGLETRNHFRNRQEKNELYLKFYFHRGPKIFLTKKQKRASPSESNEMIASADSAMRFVGAKQLSPRRTNLMIRIAVAPFPS